MEQTWQPLSWTTSYYRVQTQRRVGCKLAMGELFSGACLICQRPDTGDDDRAQFARAWAHASCHNALSADEVNEKLAAIACCPAKATILGLGGHALQRKSSIPMDEVWLVRDVDGKKHVLKFSIKNDGTLSVKSE